MKQKFIDFLKDNGIYDEFESRMLEQKVFESMDDYIYHCGRPTEFFGGAFTFSNYATQEEMDKKWNPLMAKWLKFCKE